LEHEAKYLIVKHNGNIVFQIVSDLFVHLVHPAKVRIFLLKILFSREEHLFTNLNYN